MPDARPPFPRVPDDAAIAALARRGINLEPSGHWTEIWQDEHQKAFTVAQSAGFDVLKDIFSALLEAERAGITFAEFRRNLTPILQAKGWWGKVQRIDAGTGELTEVQLGSPRRLRTIFDVNLRVSAAQGDWERQQAGKADRPYLRYVALLDDRTRPQHRLWHGTILPVDHPWWDTHYPPNGWRCRCKAMSVSDADLAAEGWSVTGQARDDGTTPWVNPRTGEVLEVPRGIDPGWAYNPGKTDAAAHAARVAMDKLAELPPRMGAQAIAALAFAFPQVERELAAWIEGITTSASAGVFHATGSRRVVGALADDVLDFLAAQGISPATAAISISDRDLFHALRTAKVQPLTAETWRKLPSLLAAPEAIYWDNRNPGLVYVVQSPDGLGKLIVLVDYAAKTKDEGKKGRQRILTNTVRTGRKIADIYDFGREESYRRIR